MTRSPIGRSSRSHRQRHPSAGDGFEWDGAQWRAVASTPSLDETDEDGPWDIELELARRGDFVGPVEVELTWSDDSVERRTWDAHTRWERWRFEDARQLEQVVVDPDVVWVLETHRADNYWRRQPARPSHPLWSVREALSLVKMLFLRFS